MRVSEKSLEICSQWATLSSHTVVWFGLTQKQEADWGFDVATRLGGLLMAFQMKAPTRDLAAYPPAKQFQLAHHQLMALQALLTHHRRPRIVFYALPLLRTTAELQAANGDVLASTMLLDLANIPSLPAPTTARGAPRKSGLHYLDISHAGATIHSEPVDLRVFPAADLIRALDDRQEQVGVSPDDPVAQGLVRGLVRVTRREGHSAHETPGSWLFSPGSLDSEVHHLHAQAGGVPLRSLG
jgi:hypothetical protein